MSRSQPPIVFIVMMAGMLLPCLAGIAPALAGGDEIPPQTQTRGPRVPWTSSRFIGTPEPPPPFTVAPLSPISSSNSRSCSLRPQGPAGFSWAS